MTGSIEGDYEYTLGVGFNAGIPGVWIWYQSGTSVVVTQGGSLSFAEAGAMDFSPEQMCLNSGGMMKITGGTGNWEGASGHLILSGHFNADPFTGDFDYQGEVCTGIVSHEQESWGKVKAKYRDEEDE
jgi:hypothetical protein